MLKIVHFLFSFPEQFFWEGQKTFSFFFFFLKNSWLITSFELTSFSGHKTSCRTRSPWVSCQASSFSFAIGILWKLSIKCTEIFVYQWNLWIYICKAHLGFGTCFMHRLILLSKCKDTRENFNYYFAWLLLILISLC